MLEYKWAVVAPDDTINTDSIKRTRTESIAAFEKIWRLDLPIGKWRYWKYRGYTCTQVLVTTEILI